jgi:hypothetical protein
MNCSILILFNRSYLDKPSEAALIWGSRQGGSLGPPASLLATM